MTIQEMLEREDIYTILSTTLEEYFSTVHHKKVVVRVERSLFKNRFVIYPRLGVIVARIPSWAVVKDIYTQFNVQGNTLKKLVAWGYITLCLLTFGLLASRSLYVSDNKWCKRYRYIMPCNRKIRLFDYKNGVVDAILKTGFSGTCFKNELQYRVNPEYDFIPPILKYGERWYRERIIVGTGLVRVQEPLYSKLCDVVMDDVRKMVLKSIHSESISDYCSQKINRVRHALPILKEQKNINTTDFIDAVLCKVSQFIVGHDVRIPLVMSHGDLQTGNIMYEPSTKRIYIYDWETAKERSIWFDMGKFQLYSQRKGRYAYMINNRDKEEVKNNLLILDEKDDYPMTYVVSVLVLEELDFFVDEILDFPGSMGTEIMDRLTDELKQTTLFG